MRDIIIEAHGLKRYYRRGSEIVKALDGVDITIRQGEIVAILGPSGSGKQRCSTCFPVWMRPLKECFWWLENPWPDSLKRHS